ARSTDVRAWRRGARACAHRWSGPATARCEASHPCEKESGGGLLDRRRPLQKTPALAVWAASDGALRYGRGEPDWPASGFPIGVAAGGLLTTGAVETPIDSYRARGRLPIT